MTAITEPHPAENPAPPVVPRLRRWLGPLFFLAGLALVPWTVYLVVTLPGRHLQTGYYDVAWGGFDLALAAVLGATGYGLLRQRLWVQSTATAAATLLLCDADGALIREPSSPQNERLRSALSAIADGVVSYRS